MVTIKDIAKKAGVSHGTVSNVINNKGNVSVSKIKLVQKAMKELGYISNESAKLLRKGATNTLSIIIPNTSETQYCHFINGIRNTIDCTKYRLQIYCTLDKLEKELEILAHLSTEQNDKVIAFSSLETIDAYTDSLANNTKITFVDRKPIGATSYFGFDSKQASAELSARLKEKKDKVTAIITNKYQYSFEKKVLTTLKENDFFKNYDTFNYSVSKLQRKIFAMIQEKHYERIFVSNPEQFEVIKDALNFLNDSSTELIGVSGSEIQFNSDRLSEYYLNYYELGVTVANNFILSHEDFSEVLTQCAGFISFQQEFKKNKQSTPITLLSVPNPTIKAIDNLKVNFEQRTSILLEITETATIGFEQKLLYETNNYDLIRIDVAQFPLEAERTFLSLNGLSDSLDKIIKKYHKDGYQKFMDVKNTTFGLPIDPSCQILFYRKDLFEDPIIKRMFYDSYKSKLSIPNSWSKFLKTTDFFKNINLKKSGIQSGLSMNTSNPSIIATDFFSGYYALNGNILFNDNIVSLDTKIAEQAVESYLNLKNISILEMDPWWDGVINNYIEGRSAMLLGYMNHLSSIAAEPIISKTGYTTSPGNKPLLGGGVIGINKNSNNIPAAIDFLLWLHEHVISREITRQGGTTASNNVNKLEEFSLTYPWLYDSMNLMSKGIRENTTPEDNPINLKIIEYSVGEVLKNTTLTNPKEIVQKINNTLARNYRIN